MSEHRWVQLVALLTLGMLVVPARGAVAGASQRATCRQERRFNKVTICERGGEVAGTLFSDDPDGGGSLRLRNGQSANHETIAIDANGLGSSGELEVRSGRVENPESQSLVRLRGDIGGGVGAQLQLVGENGGLGVNIEAGEAGRIELRDDDRPVLVAQAADGAQMSLFNAEEANLETITIDANEDLGGRIVLQNGVPGRNQTTLLLEGNDDGCGGSRLYMYTGEELHNYASVQIKSCSEGGGAGVLDVFHGPERTIRLAGLTGDTTISGVSTACRFEATGCDVAEVFELSGREELHPGMVVVMDAVRAGRLTLSTRAYDKRVVGIISGAGDLRPGIRLGGSPDDADDLPVALTGRVYCLVDAAEHAVEIGDLLTSSDAPGHAMKVTDFARSQGAVLGKAMQPLEKGKRGLILVLVALQ